MRNFCIRFLSLVLWVAILLVPVVEPARGGVMIDRVVAVVDREIITQSELDAAGQLLKKNQPGEEGGFPPAQRDLLSQMIERKLILQEAKKKGVRLTDSELELALKDIEERNQFPNREAFKRAVTEENIPWENYLEDLKNQLTVLKLMSREVDANILLGDEEVRAYYDAHPERFKLPDQIRLKQILLRVPAGATSEQVAQTRQKAEQLLAAAEGGEDFSQLAKEYSEGPERREGGDLGLFKKGELTPEIDKIVFGLEKGAISPVVESSLGFHIFKVQDLHGDRIQPFDRVRKEVEEFLLSEKREAARRKWLDGIWNRAFVEVK